MRDKGMKRTMIVPTHLFAMSRGAAACQSVSHVQRSHPDKDGNEKDR
jgi:hypothetical protein